VRAVGDVPCAELAQLRRDRVEVAERLAEQHERAQQHRLLPAHVVGEERPHRGRGLEQAGIELVHQLVAARREQVEAGLQSVQVEAHLVSLCGAMSSRGSSAGPGATRG
jgi:hypothetical protein